jgi:hypothetical protein
MTTPRPAPPPLSRLTNDDDEESNFILARQMFVTPSENSNNSSNASHNASHLGCSAVFAPFLHFFSAEGKF